MRFVIIFGLPNTGTTTLFLRIQKATTDIVIRTFDMMTGLISDPENQLIKRLKKTKHEFFNTNIEDDTYMNVKLLEDTFFEILNDDDNVIIINTIRDPIDHKISKIIQSLDIKILLERNTLMTLKEKRKQIYRQIIDGNDCIKNKYSSLVAERKKLLEKEDLLPLWNELSRSRNEYEAMFHEIKNFFGFIVEIEERKSISSNGYVVLSNENEWKLIVLKSELIDELNPMIEEIIGGKININIRGKEKTLNSCMYLFKDDVSRIVEYFRNIGKNDNNIKRLYNNHKIVELGYKL